MSHLTILTGPRRGEHLQLEAGALLGTGLDCQVALGSEDPPQYLARYREDEDERWLEVLLPGGLKVAGQSHELIELHEGALLEIPRLNLELRFGLGEPKPLPPLPPAAPERPQSAVTANPVSSPTSDGQRPRQATPRAEPSLRLSLPRPHGEARRPETADAHSPEAPPLFHPAQNTLGHQAADRGAGRAPGSSSQFLRPPPPAPPPYAAYPPQNAAPEVPDTCYVRPAAQEPRAGVSRADVSRGDVSRAEPPPIGAGDPGDDIATTLQLRRAKPPERADLQASLEPSHGVAATMQLTRALHPALATPAQRSQAEHTPDPSTMHDPGASLPPPEVPSTLFVLRSAPNAEPSYWAAPTCGMEPALAPQSGESASPSGPLFAGSEGSPKLEPLSRAAAFRRHLSTVPDPQVARFTSLHQAQPETEPPALVGPHLLRRLALVLVAMLVFAALMMGLWYFAGSQIRSLLAQ